MNAILKREFRSSMRGVYGPLFVSVLLLFGGIFTVIVNLFGGYASFETTLSNITIAYLVLLPVLCMRSLAEERHSRTDQLLYSLPLPLRSVVLGKFFALCLILAIPTLVMGLYPIIFTAFGKVNYAAAYAALLGFFLLGCALISVCLFVSSLTESQIIAAVLGFAALLLLYLASTFSYMVPSTAVASYIGFIVLALALCGIVYLLTANFNVTVVVAAVCFIPLCALFIFAPSVLAGSFPALLSYLAVFDRFNTFVYGIFDITAILYYLSFSAFFLVLTTVSLEKRRYS